MKRKTEVDFYKSDYTRFSLVNLLPVFNYGKNVQGYSFTRGITIYWFTYAVTVSVTLRSDDSIDSSLAHEINVQKYMM